MEVDVSYDGSRGIKAILVDWSDAAFLRNMMDAQSLVFFKENILKIYYGPLRSLVWYSIA